MANTLPSCTHSLRSQTLQSSLPPTSTQLSAPHLRSSSCTVNVTKASITSLLVTAPLECKKSRSSASAACSLSFKLLSIVLCSRSQQGGRSWSEQPSCSGCREGVKNGQGSLNHPIQKPACRTFLSCSAAPRLERFTDALMLPDHRQDCTAS